MRSGVVKLQYASGPGATVIARVRHQGVSLMRPDDTAPEGAMLIPLRARDGSVRAYALIDVADAEWVNQWRWSLGADGYAYRSRREGRAKHTIRLHRAILGLTRGDGQEGDHIDRDRLNCRRTNLRKLPGKGNRQNVSSTIGSSSKYRGVYFDKDSRKWRAYVQVEGRQRYFGRFNDEEAAAEAARLARIRLLPYSVG